MGGRDGAGRGCDVADARLVDWERRLLGAVQRPRQRGGRLVWDLDRVPAAVLRALCWPRRAAGPAGAPPHGG